jgi:predicted nucleotidyltransferase component of viral defense system
MNDRQTVELFHLLFLDWLGRKMDKTHYALKGGCNLRFFLKSRRYSEDMDLDVAEEPVHSLRDKVDSILHARPFRQTLTARGIEIDHITLSKQTDTVQRWKLGLRTDTVDRSLPTKIEFSRRRLDTNIRFESVVAEVAAEYRLAPILANHYGPDTAARHKVEALCFRKTPQARDVFDLHLLVSSGVDIGAMGRQVDVPASDLQARVMDITYEEFAGQVLAFLHPDDQSRYADARTWETMVFAVAEAMRKGAS